MKPINTIDPELMRRARDAAASTYAEAAVFQRHLDEELLARLLILTMQVNRVAVLGAGNPAVVQRLQALYPDATLTIFDISAQLLHRDKAALADTSGINPQTQLCELHALPGDSGAYDLVYSNLFTAMTDDLPRLLGEVRRILQPGGCFHFSCLGADTFCELREAWCAVEGTSAAHVSAVPDMHDTGDALMHAQFSEPVMDCEKVTMTYSSADALFSDLRNNGVRNCLLERDRGLTGTMRWQDFRSALYDTRVDGRYVLTLEAVLGQAWKPQSSVQTRLEDGSVAVPFERLLGSGP